MPSYVIHLAVGKEYIRKHPDEIKDIEEFEKGIIDPDMAEDKDVSHFGKDRMNIDIDKYLTLYPLKNDYAKGYLLHLITDHIFYSYTFYNETIKAKENQETFYHDYDVLNSALIEKYEVRLPKSVEKYANTIDGEPIYLKLQKMISFIDEVSEDTLMKQIENLRKEQI